MQKWPSRRLLVILTSFASSFWGGRTYEGAEGIRCAISHVVPNSKADVVQRGRAFYEWATWSNGMFGRTPDYKNASVMAFAHAPGFLAQGSKGQAGFVKNMT